ncbi:3-oxoacyl-[acyl-carrier-protein] synthase III C-terminal domain-containing protein [Streptomyces sp. BBFR2]|uniref:3-oxoacyl-[acyl-carrier-protein] synthase III C-terminal domain-containing protein n=1 Tax=Streptomyces sp. BBFR2 TaxID=3372854 RepID=UPI0037DA64FF
MRENRTVTMPQPFPYEIAGVATETGRVIPIEEWADLARLPHRKRPEHLSGQDLRRIFNVTAKSHDPELFRDFDTIVRTARRALDASRIRPQDLDCLFLATASPYEGLLDQDAFNLARLIGLDDGVVPIQAGAGCAGVARAASHIARANYRNALVVTYFLPSQAMFDENGELYPVYRTAPDAPMLTWASPATFSDAAAALVFTRGDDAGDAVLYSRDAQSFDGGPGLTHPIVRYVEGGAGGTSPSDVAGRPRYSISPPHIRHFYPTAMRINDAQLREATTHYPDKVARIYTHQGSPTMVQDLIEELGLPREKIPSNAAALGNTVSASTVLMLHDDLRAGTLGGGDRVCFSVVGSGPERGALTVPLAATCEAAA